MNKEVIYLEPEDDITDILTKLQQAEQKLVALVPPKKATILRSAVNMKLVARVAKECEKIVVIVTADPAIVKMAMAARIPVAKTLHSRPVIPTEANVRAAEADVQMIDEDGEDVTEDIAKNRKNPKNASKMPSEASSFDSEERLEKSADTIELDDDGLSEASKEAKKPKLAAKKAKKSPSGPITGFAKYRKWLYIGIPSVLVVIVLLVWAFVFAPAATITVGISSTASNFSETVRFTTDPAAENIAEGVFFAEKQSTEQSYTADFESTGEEDKGTKATGKVTISASFVPIEYADQVFTISVGEGERLTNRDGLAYVTTSSASTGWNGKDTTIVCDNGTLTGLAAMKRSCRLSITVSVEAAEAGEKYNLSAGTSWNEYQGWAVSNGSPISGGTTNMVKVISQEDVDKARDAVVAEHTLDGREMLLGDLSKDLVAIESSFKSEPGDVVATPAVGEEVKEDTKPSAKVTAIFSVFTVERSKIEEYIKSKTTLSDDQQIYSIGNPYFERFTTIEEPARLKTVVETGPIVSEEAIFEKVAGRKTGEVQSQLRSINGVSSVEIRTSYFWVWSIPTDRSKVTINLSLENEQ